MKAFVAFSSIVPSKWYNFFIRSSAGSWNGTKHVFNNLSTNNLRIEETFRTKHTIKILSLWV
jgi:hypothetical protein